MNDNINEPEENYLDEESRKKKEETKVGSGCSSRKLKFSIPLEDTGNSSNKPEIINENKSKKPKMDKKVKETANKKDANDENSGKKEIEKKPYILAASSMSGQIMYLMKWKDSNNANLVSSSEVVEKFPKAIAEFYENIVFTPQDKD